MSVSSISSASSVSDNTSPTGWLTYQQSLSSDYEFIFPGTIILGTFWNEREEHRKIIFVPLYLAGMVTFSLALPVRIVRLVVRIFLLIACIAIELIRRNENSAEKIKIRAMLVVTSFLKLIMMPIAIICPPLGYFIEQKINKHVLPHSETIFFIYALKEFTNEDAYAVLNLPFGSTKQEIKKAFIQFAKDNHPDKNSENEEEFIKYKKAYDKLITDVTIPEGNSLNNESEEKIEIKSETETFKPVSEKKIDDVD